MIMQKKEWPNLILKYIEIYPNILGRLHTPQIVCMPNGKIKQRKEKNCQKIVMYD